MGISSVVSPKVARSQVRSAWMSVECSSTQWIPPSASGALTHFDAFDGTYVDKELGLSVTYDFVPGEWSASGDLSWYDYGAPGAIDGAVLSGDLTWTFADETDMVFSAGIAQGSSAVESAEDPEWFVGLMLRRQTNVFSGGS